MLNFDETMIMKDPEIKRIVALKGENKIPIQRSGKEKKGSGCRFLYIFF